MIVRVHVVYGFQVWIDINALYNIHQVNIIYHQFVILGSVALLVDHCKEVEVHVDVNELFEADLDQGLLVFLLVVVDVFEWHHLEVGAEANDLHLVIIVDNGLVCIVSSQISMLLVFNQGLNIFNSFSDDNIGQLLLPFTII